MREDGRCRRGWVARRPCAPTDPADVQEMTAGKQLTRVDPADGAGLHGILEDRDDVTLVVEEVDGDTYVIDALKLNEIREKGHAELLIRKLKEHGQQGDVKLTLVHEDGTESAHFGTLRAADPGGNELVEIDPRIEGEYEFGPEHSGSIESRDDHRLKIEKIEAAEMEARMKEDGSR
jgi:hypothetical protein